MSEEISIPIPQYPPTKLRSSLIDKDPVIWVHLLESYIKLFILLTENKVKLSIKAFNELQQFLRVYLLETSIEESQIFSLGAINPDITLNTEKLRVYVFLFIKLYSIVKLGLLGESIWNYIIIYGSKNVKTVRPLIDGSFNSKFNEKKSGGISSIPLIHKHLEKKVVSGSFSENDLVTLSALLGQQVAVTKKTKISITSGNAAPIQSFDKSKASSNDFAVKFVTLSWINLLEKLYAQGKSVHKDILQKIMIISLISLNSSNLKILTDKLSINNIESLKKFQLFGIILISDVFNEIIPNLDEKLPWLGEFQIDASLNKENVITLQELFPELSEKRAKKLLKEFGNVETLTNELFEKPELMKDEEEEKSATGSLVRKSIYDGDKISNNDFSGTKVIFGKQKRRVSIASEDLKKKALTAALKLLYEGDEDEPDDTYEEVSGQKSEDSNPDGLLHPEADPKEMYIFQYIKNGQIEVLEKGGRKLKERKEIQNYTNWSHEQIEGWYKMLLKSPRRFKILEENYFFSRPNKKKERRVVKEEETENPSSNTKILEPSNLKRNPRAKSKSKK